MIDYIVIVLVVSPFHEQETMEMINWLYALFFLKNLFFKLICFIITGPLAEVPRGSGEREGVKSH